MLNVSSSVLRIECIDKIFSLACVPFHEISFSNVTERISLTKRLHDKLAPLKQPSKAFFLVSKDKNYAFKTAYKV